MDWLDFNLLQLLTQLLTELGHMIDAWIAYAQGNTPVVK